MLRSGLWQQFDSFLLQPFCCRFAVVFGLVVLLHDPISALAAGKMTSHLTLENIGVQRSKWSTQRLQSAEILWLQNKPTSTTVLTVDMRCLFWYAVPGFRQIWRCALWPNVLALVSSVPKDVVSDVLLSVQMQMCKPKMCCQVLFRLFLHLPSLVNLNQSQVWFPLCEHSNYTWVWTKTITRRLCRGDGSGPVLSSRAVCLWCESDLSQLPGVCWKFKLNAYRTQVCFTFWDAAEYYNVQSIQIVSTG